MAKKPSNASRFIPKSLVLAVVFLLIGFGSSNFLEIKNFFNKTSLNLYKDGPPDGLSLLSQGIHPWAQERSPEYTKQVEKLASELETSCMKGKGEEDSVECLYERLQLLAEAQGARAGLDVAVELAKDYPYLDNYSHDLSHVVGYGALRYDYKVPFSGVEARGLTGREVELVDRMGRVLVDCHSWGVMGCMHGVIEAGLGGIPAEKRTQAARRACLENPFVQSNQVFVNHCLHWLGHGMAIFTNQTLLETLQICETLDPDFSSENVQLCLSGVFHAGVSPGRTEEDDWYLHNIEKVYKADDPYYPCQDIPEKYRNACYAALPGRVGGYDLEKLYSACHSIPEKDAKKKDEYLKLCYDTVSNMMLYTVEHEADPIVKTCRAYADPAYRQYCYAGAVRYLILRSPTKGREEVYKICQGIESEAKKACYKSLGAVINETYYSEEKLREYCAKIKDKQYLEDCLSRGRPE